MMFFIFVPVLFILALAGGGLFRRFGNALSLDPKSRKDEDEDEKLSRLDGNSDISEQDSIESRIFRLAQSLNGKINISDIVIATGLGVREAEAIMDRMSGSMQVNMQVDDRGRIAYEFPEIQSRLGES